LTLTKGARFIMVLLPPFAVSSGIMVGICIGYLDLLKENKKFSIFKNKNVIKLISIGVILLVIFPGIINVHYTSSFLNPLANDDLWTASQWLENNTSNDTVIISEWSYGYLFSAVSKHPVSADGGSQNFPRTYWIYKAFSTDDENLSKGIFRMVATSGDLGPLTLDNYTKNTTKTVEILNSVLGLSKGKALQVLTFHYGLSTQEANTILNYTHPSNPRPFVIVTTTDMLNKGIWTFYFGLWDFNQRKGHNLTYSVGKTTINNNILNSSNGFSMDLKTWNGTWNGKTPYLIVIDRNGKNEKRYIDKYSNFSVFFIEKYNRTIIIDKDLENSLFIKLAIERSSSTNFKPIYENKNVLVWESNTDLN
jgi:dolichyl-diphosphooligosaccharide--protein glycosyltransferase